MSKVAFLFAGLSAVAGTALIHVYLTRLEQEATGGKKVPILVVTHDIPVGALLQKEMLATKEVPAVYVTTRQVEAKDIGQILGARATGGLKVDDTLEWTDLTEASHRDLAGLVPEGMRALSIKADNLFDGLLRPGDRVDVLFSVRQSSEMGDTSTLLQNLLVLSVGGHISRDDESHDGYQNPNSVALSVTPLQGQILTHAAERGRLELALRNPDDLSIIENLPATQERDGFGATTHGTTTARSQASDGTKDIEHVH